MTLAIDVLPRTEAWLERKAGPSGDDKASVAARVLDQVAEKELPPLPRFPQEWLWRSAPGLPPFPPDPGRRSMRAAKPSTTDGQRGQCRSFLTQISSAASPEAMTPNMMWPEKLSTSACCGRKNFCSPRKPNPPWPVGLDWLPSLHSSQIPAGHARCCVVLLFFKKVSRQFPTIIVRFLSE